MSKKLNLAKLTPVLFSFFVMGFVDIVNISTNYVKQDFALNDTWANLIPLLVFFWFAVISLPTGILMGRFGRKNTVLLSAAVTTVAMLLPLLDYSFPLVLTAFALLGIGNTILQVALNPLLMNVVPADRVASSLTLGQFIKAISSFLGPIIVGVASVSFGNWKLVFPVYAAVTVLSFVWLLLIPIPEQRESAGQSSSAGRIFAMLRDRRILVYFSVIVLIVGYEVGLLTTIPKYLTERCAIPLFCRPDNRNVRRNDHPGQSGPAAILRYDDVFCRGRLCLAVADRGALDYLYCIVRDRTLGGERIRDRLFAGDAARSGQSQ